MKTQKQGVPIILDKDNQPIAGIFFIGGKRVFCSIKEMSEEEIVEMLEIKLSTG